MELVKLSYKKFVRSPLIMQFLTVYGVYHFTKHTLYFLNWLRKNVFLFPQDLRGKYGNGWVVITGASDGIGYEYAEQFVSLNFRVCLMGRNEEKLKAKVEILHQKYPSSDLRYIVFDFDVFYTDEEIEKLKNEIVQTTNSDVSIFVNNVASGTIKYFRDFTYKEMRTILNVNVSSMVFLTKIMVEIMSKKKKTLMISSGSIFSRIRLEKLSMYSGSKSFMEAFMFCLGKEYPNIDFTYFEIGDVESNIKDLPSVTEVTPEEVVKGAMIRMGKYKSISPHLKHAMFHSVLHRFPFVATYWYKKKNI